MMACFILGEAYLNGGHVCGEASSRAPPSSSLQSMHNNPYNVWMPATRGDSEPPPSVFGALPYTNPGTSSQTQNENLAFTFTSFNTTVLNCIVLGPNNTPQFQICTPSMPGYTVLNAKNGTRLAAVQWAHSGSNIEVPTLIPSQPIGSFLSRSSDQR